MSSETAELESEEQASPEASNSPYVLLVELEGAATGGRQAAFDLLKGLLADQKLELTPSMFMRHCLDSNPDYYVADLLEEFENEELEVERILEDLHSGLAMQYSGPEMKLNPAVSQLIDAALARDIPVVLLSGLEEELAEGLVSRLGLDREGIQLLVVPDEELVFPRVDAWQQAAMQQGGRPPQHYIVVGGSRQACRAGLAAGMRCIATPDELTAFQDFSGADAIVDRADDLDADAVLTEVLPKDED